MSGYRHVSWWKMSEKGAVSMASLVFHWCNGTEFRASRYFPNSSTLSDS